MQPPHARAGSKLLRSAIALAFVGVLGVLPLLFAGFSALTMGFGICLGFPCLVLALVLYAVAVFGDLRGYGLV